MPQAILHHGIPPSDSFFLGSRNRANEAAVFYYVAWNGDGKAAQRHDVKGGSLDAAEKDGAGA
jgi:hypothetical protein